MLTTESYFTSQYAIADKSFSGLPAEHRVHRHSWMAHSPPLRPQSSGEQRRRWCWWPRSCHPCRPATTLQLGLAPCSGDPWCSCRSSVHRQVWGWAHTQTPVQIVLQQTVQNWFYLHGGKIAILSQVTTSVLSAANLAIQNQDEICEMLSCTKQMWSKCSQTTLRLMSADG